MPINVSRNIIRMIVDGMLSDMRFVLHEKTKLSIPLTVCQSVDDYLVPERRWENISDYNEACSKLMRLFENQMKNR